MIYIIKTIISFIVALFILLAGVIIYITMIPVSINYLLFFYVVPIAIIIIVLFILCIKYNSTKMKITAFLYILFSALSFLTMVYMDKRIGGGLQNLDKNYFALALSGILLGIGVVNLLRFIELIFDEKKLKMNMNQNQIVVDQEKDEELKK